MGWESDHWGAGLFRKDLAFLFHENSPDFNRVVRDACKAIRLDMSWVGPPAAARDVSVDRYEVKDVRNGAALESAILDKKTGKVWVWREDKNTGTSTFVSEELVPEPSNDQ
jgi:hypothetical protein